jgi:L-alanine-DL-glutamate epimerase-like enolase superfamily enzyme
MQINKVEAIPINVPYPVPVTISTGTLYVQESVLVRITADDGTIGLGETQPIPFFQGCAETQDTVLTLVRSVYTSLLLGQDPFDIEKLNQDMERALRGGEYARAAVGDALYDLVARALDIPLYKLLGGCYRDKIPCVWSIGMKPTQAMADEARRELDRGYFLLKCKIGAPDPDTDVANVAAIREALGPDVSFRVDANAGLRYSEALARLKRMVGPYSLEFVEQPVAIWDLDGLARLSDVLCVPIMADESANSIHAVIELVKRKAASIIDIKLAKMGGVYSARKIAAIADAAGIPLYAGGQVATSVGAATAAHFFAATWNVIGGDFQLGPDGWLAADIVKKPLQVKDGYALVPEEGPGIGVELDEEKLEKVAVKK